MAARVAALDMAAEAGRAALLDRRHHLERGQVQVPGPTGAIGGTGGTEDVGQGCRREDAGQRRERSGQLIDREDDAAEQQECDEQRVGQGERRLGAERARHQETEPGECQGPEQEPDHEEGR